MDAREYGLFFVGFAFAFAVLATYLKQIVFTPSDIIVIMFLLVGLYLVVKKPKGKGV